MDFVTVGMFIIDEIHYQPPRAPDNNVMGGAGLYAALGARLFRPLPSSTKVGWTVHTGYDFPSHMQEIIEFWGTRCQFIPTPNRPTTRAHNAYEPNGYRSFRYLNDKLRIDEGTLTTDQLMSRTFHLICSGERCISVIEGIDRKRRQMANAENSDEPNKKTLSEKPIFIWEPFPDLCKPSEFEVFSKALGYVDVVSPNLEEFANLLGISIDLGQPSGWDLLRTKCIGLVETCSRPSEVALVLRLGEKGCSVTQAGRYFTLPSYHGRATASRVVDSTGGGNAFLGGFAVGTLESEGLSRAEMFEEAAIYGAVAASFAIEQVGVPRLKRLAPGGEVWNDEDVGERLKRYRERIAGRAHQAEDC